MEKKGDKKKISSNNLTAIPKKRKLSDSYAFSIFSPKITSVYKEWPNLQYNEEMQDMGKICNSVNGFSTSNLYCIFDGHGGKKCAKVCYDTFDTIFKKYHRDNPINIEHCFNVTYKKTDEKAQAEGCLLEGSTCTSVFIDKNTLYCANVGDSKCMLVSEKEAKEISVEDKCSNPDEAKRITSSGGKVSDDRLNGILMVSRSIGDFDLKGKGLISQPHLNKITLTHKDKFCVLASDGIWDAVNEEELYDMSVNVKVADELAEKLIKFAVDKGSQDNISVIVIKFE